MKFVAPQPTKIHYTEETKEQQRIKKRTNTFNKNSNSCATAVERQNLNNFTNLKIAKNQDQAKTEKLNKIHKNWKNQNFLIAAS